jgi:hypothetical protein
VATVHLHAYADRVIGEEWRELGARTLQIPRSMNVESLAAWYKQCRKAFRGRYELPLSYKDSSVTEFFIMFEAGDYQVTIDRKRAML